MEQILSYDLPKGNVTVIMMFDKNMKAMVHSPDGLVWFSLAWFYGISTIVGYLMPNPFLYT